MTKKPKINTSPPQDVTIFERDKSDIFKITEDKLRLKLDRLKDSIEDKTSLFGYAGITMALIISLITNDFKDFLIGRDLWKAIFIVSFILVIILSIKKLFSFLFNRKNIDNIIEDIKREQK